MTTDCGHIDIIFPLSPHPEPLLNGHIIAFILGDQTNPPVPCIKEETDFVADRVIKEEDEDLDDASIELVLPDHDTVIHLPNVRSNRNKHGYSVSFEGKQVIIKRRGVGKQLPTMMTTNRKTDSSKFTETIVIDEEDQSASVIQID